MVEVGDIWVPEGCSEEVYPRAKQLLNRVLSKGPIKRYQIRAQTPHDNAVSLNWAFLQERIGRGLLETVGLWAVNGQYSESVGLGLDEVDTQLGLSRRGGLNVALELFKKGDLVLQSNRRFFDRMDMAGQLFIGNQFIYKGEDHYLRSVRRIKIGFAGIIFDNNSPWFELPPTPKSFEDLPPVVVKGAVNSMIEAYKAFIEAREMDMQVLTQEQVDTAMKWSYGCDWLLKQNK